MGVRDPSPMVALYGISKTGNCCGAGRRVAESEGESERRNDAALGLSGFTSNTNSEGGLLKFRVLARGSRSKPSIAC